jgi:hypothetical protein
MIQGWVRLGLLLLVACTGTVLAKTPVDLVCAGPAPEFIGYASPVEDLTPYRIYIDDHELMPCIAHLFTKPAPGSTRETTMCGNAPEMTQEERCGVIHVPEASLEEKLGLYMSIFLFGLMLENDAPYDMTPLEIREGEVPFAPLEDLHALRFYNGREGLVVLASIHRDRLRNEPRVLVVAYPF